MDLTEQYAHEAPEVAKRIWGSPEAIILIFAGSSAEFAVNKAVDWLFFTNALPDQPIERFFETVRFAQAMVFGDRETRTRAIREVNRAHRGVERARGDNIPQWAHRDVLYMLIDYGERAHHLLFGPMTPEERQEFFTESIQIGRELGIRDLPQSYEDYRRQRVEHLRANTAHSEHTDLLYKSYRKHLGPLRMGALLKLQSNLVPREVRQHLGLRPSRLVSHLMHLYRRLHLSAVTRLLRPVLLPRHYSSQLATLADW
jgi:uncharacterized protein (DUF2236 family)